MQKQKKLENVLQKRLKSSLESKVNKYKQIIESS